MDVKVNNRLSADERGLGKQSKDHFREPLPLLGSFLWHQFEPNLMPGRRLARGVKEYPEGVDLSVPGLKAI